jgi:hypothetical protein
MKKLVAAVLYFSLGTTPLALTACTAAQAANIISTLESYLQYVSTFVSIAQGIWAVISPLLGSNVAPAANAQFNKAITDVQDASVAMEDALAAARVANNPNPNLSALVANCTSAVDEVAAAIAQYGAPSASTSKVGDQITTLEHMRVAIHGWH